MLGCIVKTIFAVAAMALFAGCGSTPRREAPAEPFDQASVREGLSGPYLGQVPPGSYPESFAYGIVAGDLHSAPVFAPDGSEAYWAKQGAIIVRARYENGAWTEPERVSFSQSMTDYRDPFITPAGDKLFFLSKGLLPDSTLPVKENIWFVERTAAGWSEPAALGEEVNSNTLHWQISVAANGNLYFTSMASGGDIFMSECAEGRYHQAEKLSDSINTDMTESTPYIAPDESYMIFSRMKDGNAAPRLYISYANEDGGWSDAVLIDKVGYGLCPTVTPDGLYLLFLSSPRSVSWMTADFIGELKP